MIRLVPEESTPLERPISTRPTPEVLDDLFYEIVDSTKADFVSIPEGSYNVQQRDFPDHRLVKEERIAWNRVRRWWSNGFSNQDTYNYDIEYQHEGTGFPLYVRRYLVRRDQDAALTVDTPLAGIWMVKVTAGGANYTAATTTLLTGGTGSGATALPIISDGVIVWIKITAEGSYTVVPNVVIADTGGGSGATATAVLQAQLAVLVHQESKELPTDDPRRSLYVQVIRVFKLLPGPTMTNREWASGGLQKKIEVTDVLPTTTLNGGVNLIGEKLVEVSKAESQRLSETLLSSTGGALADGAGEYTLARRDGKWRVTIYTTFRIVAASFSLPQEGSTFSITYPATRSGRVIEGVLKSIDGSPNCMAEITWTDAPLARVDYPDYRYPFPGIHRVINANWFNDESIGALIRHPWHGVDDEWRPVQSNPITARRTLFFTHDPTAYLPVPYKVTSPGAGSKAYPYITENSVHGPIKLYFDYTDANGNAASALIEDIPASSPTRYDPSSILVASSTAEPWEGRWYVRTVIEVSELVHPQQFPPLFVQTPFIATNQVDLISHIEDFLGPDVDGTPLLAFSSSASDTTQTLKIYGKKDGSSLIKTETITLTGTAYVKTARENWRKLNQIHLSATTVGTIDVRLPGVPNAGSVTFESGITSGTTLTIVRNADTRVFTFTKPETTTLTCGDLNSIGSKATDTLTLNSNPLNTETVTVGGKTYTYQTVLTNVDGNVLIGASASASIDNLIAAIILSAGAGTTFAGQTTVNTQVTAAAGAGDTMVVTAINGGSGGNSIAATETFTDGASVWASTTLTGGSVGYITIYNATSDAATPAAVFVWFDKTGSDTAPAFTAPQRRIRIDLSSAAFTDAEFIAGEVSDALVTDGSWLVSRTTSVLTIADKFFGTRTDATTTNLASPWAVAIASQGAAAAANQLRLGPSLSDDSESLRAAIEDMATAITSGKAATGTTTLSYAADVDASIITEIEDGVAVSDPTVYIADKFYINPGSITWTLTPSNSFLTVVNVSGGGAGQLVAQFPAASSSDQRDAYPDIDFWNPDLTELNLPAAVSGVSNAVESAQHTGYFVVRAAGTPGISFGYQTSTDAITWSGTTAIATVGNGNEFRLAVPLANYVRLTFTGSNTVRAVHASVALNLIA